MKIMKKPSDGQIIKVALDLKFKICPRIFNSSPNIIHLILFHDIFVLFCFPIFS